MNNKQKLLQEIEKTPDEIIEEVLNFMLFTKSRYQENLIKNKIPSDINESNSRPIWELAQEIAESISNEF